MTGLSGLTTIICVAALGLGLAACGGDDESGTSGMQSPAAPDPGESIDAVRALDAALEAAKATGADGTFDDTSHMIAPSITATHDGTAVTVGVTEGGMRQDNGTAGGSFAEREEGPDPSPGGPAPGSSVARRSNASRSIPTSACPRRWRSRRKTSTG